MNITVLDGVVIAIVVISALLAMFRGFVREILSIAAWVAAAILAYLFYEDLVPYTSQYVDNPSIAIAVSAAAIFLLALIVVSLITMKISDYVMDSPVGPIDRFLGLLFGAARGILLMVVAVIFFNWLVDEENRPDWIADATLYPELSNLGNRLLAAIPENPEAVIRDAVREGADAVQDTAEEITDPEPDVEVTVPEVDADVTVTEPAPAADTAPATDTAPAADPALDAEVEPEPELLGTDPAAPDGADAPATNGVQN